MKKYKNVKKLSDWTKREDEMLMNACQNFKGNWGKISEMVGTNKDAKDCKSRWYTLKNSNN